MALSNKNQGGKQASKRRSMVGKFETMEDRKMFAADLLGAADMVMDAGDQTGDTEMRAGYVKLGDIKGDSIEMESSSSRGIFDMPAPDDDDPPGPIGPVYHTVAEIGIDSILNEVKPADDDDSPGGPIGPVYKVGDLVLMDMPQLNPTEVVMPTIQTDAPGDTDGKPGSEIDCDGNPLTASCDLTSEQPEEEGKPDPDPDCDHPLAASCDYQAEEPVEEAKPDPEIDCDGNPLTASCDLTSEQPMEEAKPDPEIDCDGNPLTASCDLTSEPDFDHSQHPGDTNGDGVTDFKDFLALSKFFGSDNATRQQGDFDGDGDVDFGDFLTLSKAYGTRATAVDLVFAL